MTLRSSAPSRRGLISAFTAVYLVWGSTYLAIAFAIDSMPPLIMIGSRFVVAGLLVYAYMSLRGKAQPTRRMWRSSAVVGTLTLGVGTGAVAWAEQWLASGVAALLVTSVPLWMVLLDWKWKGGLRPNRFVVAGLTLGFVGIVLLVHPAELVQSMSSEAIASLVVLLGAFSWSFGAILGRDAELPEHPLMSTATQMITGGSVLVVGGLLRGEAAGLDVAQFTSASWLAWSYLVVFGSIVAFSSFVWLMKNAPPGQVATYAYVNPIVAVFLGWMLADEYVGGRVLLAVVVLVTAVVLISRYGQGQVTPRPRRNWSRFLDAMAHSLDGPVNSAPLRLLNRERTTE